jgi:hypothetical protein
MRQLIPWALLGLVLVGAAVGMGVGLALAP